MLRDLPEYTNFRNSNRLHQYSRKHLKWDENCLRDKYVSYLFLSGHDIYEHQSININQLLSIAAGTQQ